MPFEVLTTGERDLGRWLYLASDLPPTRRDIHFRPEYAVAQSMLGVTPRLAVLYDRGDVVIQPFIVRPIELDGQVSDIASPYGYGGPTSNVSDQEVGFAFAAAFAEWCRDNRVIDEYCVLHPFFETHQRWLLLNESSVQRRKDVVYIWLRPGFESQYRHDRRAGIERARAAGVAVERVEPTRENMAAFCELYRSTMLRKRASDRWYFPDEYLLAHFGMGPELASLFFARVDGEVEVASLVLHAHSTAYYHLTGNRMANPKLGANDMLVHEVATWAMDQGYDRLHLGGGVTSAPDDSLLEYKAGFSQLRAPVYSYFRVFDERRYNDLCAAKRAEEVKTLGREIESDFVPAYRREAA